MTSEQAKQLKTGDKILVAAEVVNVYKSNGEAYIRISCFDGPSERITFNGAYTLADNIILPTDMQQPAEKPKYDPCRLFKKGDKVMLRKWCGRNPVIYGMNLFQLGEVLNVDEAENPKEEGLILVSNAECKQSIHACYLELVTPVEERSPYYVKENASVYEVFNRNENNSSVAIFFKSQYSIEKAKERAEAECKRLNAEYGKEVGDA